MSFYAPFMGKMDEERRIFEKAREQNKTKEEIRYKEKKERMKAIEDLLDKGCLLGAQTIQEYKGLQEEVAELEEENNYRKWFNDNREEIGKFFKIMSRKFLFENCSYITFVISDDLMTTGNFAFNRKFFTKLLKAYDYDIRTEFTIFGNKVINVYYRKKKGE